MSRQLVLYCGSNTAVVIYNPKVITKAAVSQRCPPDVNLSPSEAAGSTSEAVNPCLSPGSDLGGGVGNGSLWAGSCTVRGC